MITRRNLLEQSSLIALAPFVPGFLARSLQAAEKPTKDDRVLVVIHLEGGNDGINTVVPFRDEGYAAHRSALRLPSDRLIRVRDDVALHPSIRDVNDLLEDGKLSIVQAVGYPNPDRSHFRSTAIWNTARLDESPPTDFGWIGRALDGAKRGGSDSLFVGPEKLPVALRGRRSVAASMIHDDPLQLATPIKPQTVFEPSAPGDDLSAFVQRSVLEAYTTVDELADARHNSESTVRYPSTRLSARLRLVAQLIKSGLSTRVFYTLQSGYDTHSVQLPTHARLLDEFAGALKAFIEDLSRAKIAERVLVMAFSEFGRRVRENASLGTDHGTAGPVFIAGPSAKAGLVGSAPSLVDLADGDLKSQFDFRQVYATLLQNWLRIPSQPALGESFEPLPLLKLEGEPTRPD